MKVKQFLYMPWADKLGDFKIYRNLATGDVLTFKQFKSIECRGNTEECHRVVAIKCKFHDSDNRSDQELFGEYIMALIGGL